MTKHRVPGSGWRRPRVGRRCHRIDPDPSAVVAVSSGSARDQPSRSPRHPRTASRSRARSHSSAVSATRMAMPSVVSIRNSNSTSCPQGTPGSSIGRCRRRATRARWWTSRRPLRQSGSCPWTARGSKVASSTTSADDTSVEARWSAPRPGTGVGRAEDLLAGPEQRFEDLLSAGDDLLRGQDEPELSGVAELVGEAVDAASSRPSRGSCRSRGRDRARTGARLTPFTLRMASAALKPGDGLARTVGFGARVAARPSSWESSG